jgi:putative holliday junction resolvase|uniref:Holliday junction resolvase RuvX n=1 Tax=Candidatus Planktophila sp. TaxID=2175601 RepID=UPI0040493AF8
MMQRGRRIAFDYGDVRIGVAVSDPDSILCSPLTTLKATDNKLLAQILELINEIEPVQLFVGNPALLSGKDGQASEKALSFAQQLRTVTDLEVVMVDERMSTVSAARNLRESGKNAKESKESIDMAAAIAILEFGIELQKSRS